MGKLATLLWFPEIRFLDLYLVSSCHLLLQLLLKIRFQRDVEVTVANCLDILSLIDSKKVLNKVKLHILAHIQEDIICFGPLVGVATFLNALMQCFECALST